MSVQGKHKDLFHWEISPHSLLHLAVSDENEATQPTFSSVYHFA
ncbi:hypothetical protein P781_11900 [Vibrio mimicus CAIM 1883]|nr:hypothetical protein P781_11900 [Vibrio mimicus CAIM 1883]ERM55168.1 hypothetical protein P780_11875 [Vibrio mimicus CAIM 1882]